VNYKQDRIKTLIVNEVLKIIAEGEVKDPRIPKIITITRISLSKDLHYCHLYFTFLNSDTDKVKVTHGLNSASGFFQKLIGERLKIRFTPKIEFVFDEEEDKAYKISKLLSDLSKEREKKEQKNIEN
jgi:ribosome-binding factor A